MARFARVTIAGELIVQVFANGLKPPIEISRGLPDGATYVCCFGGPNPGELSLVFEHESFEDLPVSNDDATWFALPRLTPRVARV